MLTAIGSAFTQIITWVGQTVGAITTESGALHELLPLLAIGVGCTVLMFGVKILRSFTWGA